MSITSNQEVNKFNILANQWWSKTGKFKILHDFTPPRLEFILNNIKNHFLYTQNQNIKILDIGCGGGIITEPLFKNNYNIEGIDASEKSIEVAKLHAKSENLSIPYFLNTPENLLQETTKYHSYDVILALEIIEHVDNPSEFIQTIAKFLKPNGLIFISTINKTFKSLIFAKIFAEYLLNWLPKGTHDFNKFISPQSLTNNLSEANFILKNIKGIDYNILKNLWELKNKPTINYISCFTSIKKF